MLILILKSATNLPYQVIEASFSGANTKLFLAIYRENN